MSLSMGSPYFLAFLNQQTQPWKDKFIHSFISLDGAFGGSTSSVNSLISDFCTAKFAHSTSSYYITNAMFFEIISRRSSIEKSPTDLAFCRVDVANRTSTITLTVLHLQYNKLCCYLRFTGILRG